MIICIHCTMRALLDKTPAPSFAETIEEHMRRCHPDPEATQKERTEMERRMRALELGDLL